MKTQDKIPTNKLKRAAKMLSAGTKVGRNYLKYFANKSIGNTNAKEKLDSNNAEDIFSALSQLKGGALKVAQIMSMDKNLLPQAMTKKFALAQYKAPPLSYPLVVNTFKKSFNKTPLQIFDYFSKIANRAASIGQVHKADLNNEKLAVKIQYPGVALSIRSDIKLLKPIAMRVLSLREREINQYLQEIEDRLIEETDYILEIKQSIEISKACRDIEGVYFPKYYPNLSSDKIITMSWLEGEHLTEFIESNPSQEIRDIIAQRLWDFFDFQVNKLNAIHADPHPGNFLFNDDGTIGIIDFGCVKRIPKEFYLDYFQLLNPKYQKDDSLLEKLFYKLEFIYPEDDDVSRKMFFSLFKEIMFLLVSPFMNDEFDFSNKDYINKIYNLGNELKSKKNKFKNGAARGSKHILYINKTYFGLFSILHDLKAKVKTNISFKF